MTESEPGPRPHRSANDRLWAALRWLWRRTPLRDRARDRLKAQFYAVYGRIWPRSFRYRVYRAIADSRAGGGAAPSGDIELVASGATASVLRSWDVLVFPVIDWDFRRQRPQHLALELGKRGHRVFYFETRLRSGPGVFEPAPRRVGENVYELALPCEGRPPVIHEEAFRDSQLGAVLEGLEILRRDCQLGATVSIVDHPSWLPVVEGLRNNLVVYDCMDHHAGFDDTPPFVLDYERRMLERADLVVTSSKPLASRVADGVSRRALIRNGTEYDHFAETPPSLAIGSDRPVAGYYGAVAPWLDVELLHDLARRLDHVDFHLVGHCSGVDIGRLRRLPNVYFTGEVTYAELPRYLHAFDVCLIPFRVVELTRCANPVKVYEYLSAGKPVVSTPLPEVEQMLPIVRIAATVDEFAESILEALADSSPESAAKLREFARANTWDRRGQKLLAELDSLFPKVSVIVLTYNELAFTQACLDSLGKFTDYPNWELIVVDNASSDETPAWLQTFAADHDHVRIILNDENLGFAAGNNLGAQAATGDYLVFLNNDTYVTRGWLGDLLAHFRSELSLGALGPVTNNIGNEARVDIAYQSIDEMHRIARRHTNSHRREALDIPMLAFFCVMIPRVVWERVGPLDERFGTGFFEDDDYAMRLRQAGYSIRCAEDVFIHHHLSGSFDKLPQSERDALFLRNKAIWEEKWGPWTAHRHREERQTGDAERLESGR